MVIGLADPKEAFIAKVFWLIATEVIGQLLSFNLAEVIEATARDNVVMVHALGAPGASGLASQLTTGGGGLTEVVVIGIPDDLLGNKLVALIVAEDSRTNENTVLAACMDRLPRYKIPARIEFTRSLPKSMSGKIDKEKCIQMINR